MVRAFASVIFLLALLSAAYAENYSMSYELSGWAKVTRRITFSESGCAAVTGACSATGASSALGTAGTTMVVLTVENAGLAGRDSVSLAEDIAYVPTGAKLNLSPNASNEGGRLASWSMGSLKKGEKKDVSYSFSARLEGGRAELLAEPHIASAPARLLIAAPRSARVGEKVSISVSTLSGESVPNAAVTVSSPAGAEQEIRTNSHGIASFSAAREGFYTYSIEGYPLAKLVSTESLPKVEAAPLAAASAGGLDTQIVSAILGMLPLLGGVLALAIIALIIYNFMASREESYSPPSPSAQAMAIGAAPPSQPASYQAAPASTAASAQPAAQAEAPAPVYTQRYTFGGEEKKEDPIRDATRSLVESRKKQMQSQEVASVEPERNHYAKEPEAPKSPEMTKAPERTVVEEEAEEELAHLEEQARSEGEVSKQEDEIERAIAELEAIRQKLRVRKNEVEATESELERQIEEMEREEASPQEPAPKKPFKPSPGIVQPSYRPATRILPPKGKVTPSVKPVGKK